MSENLIKLASWLAGDFSNRDQAWATPAWFSHIRICLRPLPKHVFDGIGFYSEQADDFDWTRPYRVRVLHFVERPDGTIESRNFMLKDPARYLGACRERERLESLTVDQLDELTGCTMLFEAQGDCFQGRMRPGKGCRVFRKDRDTYLDSEATVSETLFMSLDRGLDPETNVQIWGSVSGPFHFKKWTDFTPEVPTLI